FVLGFIAIAMATILRFKEYEAKALLVKLIIAALLVNFSLVICGLMIDASHMAMRQFLGVNTTFIQDIQQQTDRLIIGINTDATTVAGFALAVISIGVLGTIKACVYG